jgi:hypothetical protein
MKVMQVRFAYLVAAFSMLYMLSSCDKEESDAITLRGMSLTQTTEVYSGWNVSFTTLATTLDKDKIYLAFRQGSEHNSFDGKIMETVSLDRGYTWSSPRVIYKPTTKNGDARDPQYLRLSNGDLLCRFFERVSTDRCGTYVIVASDLANNYSGKYSMAYWNSIETYSAARGNMVQLEDTIYSVLYNNKHETWMVKSQDYGKTWEFVSSIGAQIDREASGLTNTEMNEVSLCYQNEKMYFVARRQTFEYNNLLVAESYDLGETWTNWHEIPIKGHAPSLYAYKDYMILSYRNIEVDVNDGKFLFQLILLKDGYIASDPITVDQSSIFDIGYGDVIALDDTNFLVSYYKDGATIYVRRFTFNTFTNVQE